jgi:hypothetical protein
MNVNAVPPAFYVLLSVVRGELTYNDQTLVAIFVPRCVRVTAIVSPRKQNQHTRRLISIKLWIRCARAWDTVSSVALNQQYTASYYG